MTTAQQTATTVIRANELRKGDTLRIDGHIRTVDFVNVGRSETSISLTGSTFPASLILWNGDDCKLAA